MNGRGWTLGVLLFLGPMRTPTEEPDLARFEQGFEEAVHLAKGGELAHAARRFEDLAGIQDPGLSWQAAFNAGWCRAARAAELQEQGASTDDQAFELRRARESIVEALRRRPAPWLRQSLEAVGRRLEELKATRAGSESGGGDPDRQGDPPGDIAPGDQGQTSPGGPASDTGTAAEPGSEGAPRTAQEVEAILAEILAEMRRREARQPLPRSHKGETAW